MEQPATQTKYETSFRLKVIELAKVTVFHIWPMNDPCFFIFFHDSSVVLSAEIYSNRLKETPSSHNGPALISNAPNYTSLLGNTYLEVFLQSSWSLPKLLHLIGVVLREFTVACFFSSLDLISSAQVVVFILYWKWVKRACLCVCLAKCQWFCMKWLKKQLCCLKFRQSSERKIRLP